jgi:hypothetical protein
MMEIKPHECADQNPKAFTVWRVAASLIVAQENQRSSLYAASF